MPAAFLCAMGPHVYAVASAHKLYDNTNPRSFKDNLAKDATIDDAVRHLTSPYSRTTPLLTE